MGRGLVGREARTRRGRPRALRPEGRDRCRQAAARVDGRAVPARVAREAGSRHRATDPSRRRDEARRRDRRVARRRVMGAARPPARRPGWWPGWPKSAFDLVVASVRLIALAPLLGITALAIPLVLGRPVIFAQRPP